MKERLAGVDPGVHRGIAEPFTPRPREIKGTRGESGRKDRRRVQVPAASRQPNV